jgi:hypothetical protein
MPKYDVQINWKDGDKQSETFDTFLEVTETIQQIMNLVAEEDEMIRGQLDSIIITKDGKFFAEI